MPTRRSMMLATLAALAPVWPASAFSQAEHLTVQSWMACPTVEDTIHWLAIDGYSAICERIPAGARMIVERSEQVPATRFLCIDHPTANGGKFTLCNWQTFQDEPKTWLCAHSPNAEEHHCKWGPAEYFAADPTLTTAPQRQ